MDVADMDVLKAAMEAPGPQTQWPMTASYPRHS